MITDPPPLKASGLAPLGGAESTRSVQRACALLEALGRSAVPLRMSDLALATMLSKATVHRLLKALLVSGFIAKIGLCYYTLGDRFLELATLSGSPADSHRLARQLRPYLLELYGLASAVVSFAVLHHMTVRYPEVLHHRNHLPPSWSSGKAVPAHRTAAGKLLLAYRPTAVEWLTGVELTSLADPDLVGFNEALGEFPLIRARGLAWAQAPGCAGEIEIAAPVVGPGGTVLAALSVSGPAERIDSPSTSLHIVHVARCASAALRRPSAAEIPVDELGVTHV